MFQILWMEKYLVMIFLESLQKMMLMPAICMLLLSLILEIKC